MHNQRQTRIDVYTAMLSALDRWAEVSSVVEQAGSEESAERLLCELLDITQTAAEVVLSMPLRSLANRTRLEESLAYAVNAPEGP